MKNYFVIAAILSAFFLASCREDQPEPVKHTGTLVIELGFTIQVHEVSSSLKATPRYEDLKVVVYLSDGTEIISFESAALMPDTIELATGDYFVEAFTDNNLPASFENPYYFGSSGLFTISSNMQETVSVTCQLSNTIVSVTYSGNITGNFDSYTTTVSSSSGSLVFAQDETRWGYFQPLPLGILVELGYEKPDGSAGSKTLTGSIPDPLPNRHYEIRVDASIDEGMAALQILLDTSEVLVEMIEITEDSSVPSGSIGYGELLITEIMYDPSALTDTEGEWFEIYNCSDHAIGLQGLVVLRDDLNSHVVAEPVELPPREYFVFQRTAGATDASNHYEYGTALTLPNTGAVLALHNEDTGSGPGALIFSLDYGSAGFPSSSGASLCLDPGQLNASAAVLGSSWCTSVSAYSTGDLGTPGSANDPCQN
jgi:hypothetical protein